MTREEKALRKAIWESFEGCECKMYHDGRSIPAKDRCTKTIIRCQGRDNSWRDRLAKAGLELIGFKLGKP